MISELIKSLTIRNIFKGFKMMRELGVRNFLRKVYGIFSATQKECIYPISLPKLEIRPDLDFLLLELPPRYVPMLPNGIGYVNNILKKSGISFQILDMNIICYHWYHSDRILNKMNPVVTPDGYMMKEDPWDNTNTAEWEHQEVIGYFMLNLEELIQDIVVKKPKAVGISVHGSNRVFAKAFVKELRSRMPEIIIVAGGYDCVYYEIGPYLFPDFDYMVIGEAEMTLEPLVKAIARGEKPMDILGIVSRYDSPDRMWMMPPLLEDLDLADYPKYEWTELSLYRTYNNNHLMPIAASRGCRWSRCRFCAECFPFRKRSPQKVADEIEFMASKGFCKFHFNESDVNGDPKNLYDICSEIIRKGLKVNLMGQLRIDKRNTREYFEHLAKAGFVHLRFGVDGWSDNVLRLQRKGYNMKLVLENLRDCYKAGIVVTVNMVLGVPGETEDDVNEMIKNLVQCKDYITVEGINTLILAAGSEYYKHPDECKIRFRGDKDEIYRNNPYYIPTDLWYSEEPHIDQEVRVKRLDKICTELYKQKVDIGPFAARVVENLKKMEKAVA